MYKKKEEKIGNELMTQEFSLKYGEEINSMID